MSYFQTKPAAKRLSARQLDMQRMHWSEYLDKYPLANGGYDKDGMEGDFDNYIDNFDDPEEPPK